MFIADIQTFITENIQKYSKHDFFNLLYALFDKDLAYSAIRASESFISQSLKLIGFIETLAIEYYPVLSSIDFVKIAIEKNVHAFNIANLLVSKYGFSYKDAVVMLHEKYTNGHYYVLENVIYPHFRAIESKGYCAPFVLGANKYSFNDIKAAFNKIYRVETTFNHFKNKTRKYNEMLYRFI